MRQAVHILVGVFLASALGCDGYVRLLYLQQPGMGKPPWSFASRTIAVTGDEDVRRLVSDVAGELGLAYDTRLNGYTVAVRDHGKLTMSAFKEENGRWVIRLLDWPSPTRSQTSIDAEKAVRAAVDSGKYRGGHTAAG